MTTPVHPAVAAEAHRPSMVEAMARALWLDDARLWLQTHRALGRIPEGGVIDPAQYDELADPARDFTGFRMKWEGQARAALRAILEHGPTPAMEDAGCHEWQQWTHDDRAGDQLAAVIAATLRAALEEGKEATPSATTTPHP